MAASTSGKVLVVTGGGRGIGAAVARLAAASGYAVGLCYRRDKAAAEAVAAAIRGEGEAAQAAERGEPRPRRREHRQGRLAQRGARRHAVFPQGPIFSIRTITDAHLTRR